MMTAPNCNAPHFHDRQSAAEATTEGTKVHESSKRPEWYRRDRRKLVSGPMAYGCRRPRETNQYEREGRAGRFQQKREAEATILRCASEGPRNCREVWCELGRAVQPCRSR